MADIWRRSFRRLHFTVWRWSTEKRLSTAFKSGIGFIVEW